jgi:hypothetical protein
MCRRVVYGTHHLVCAHSVCAICGIRYDACFVSGMLRAAQRSSWLVDRDHRLSKSAWLEVPLCSDPKSMRPCASAHVLCMQCLGFEVPGVSGAEAGAHVLHTQLQYACNMID